KSALVKAVGVHAIDEAHRVFPRHIAVGIWLCAGFVYGREFVVKHAFHVGSHDVPFIKVRFFAVLTKHEDAIDSTWREVLCELLNKLWVAVEGKTFFRGERLDLLSVLIILNERRRIIGIISKGICGHIGEKVHTSKPR